MTRANKTNKPPRTPMELVNPGTSGIVYDQDGHNVGGGQRVTLDGDPDRVAMRQLEAGHLLAQRGDTWLVVRDGKLADPASDETTADDEPPALVPEPRGSSGTAE